MIARLGEKLKILRTFYGYTQLQVAETLDVDRSTLSYYERGRSDPPLSTLVRLSRLYKVTTDWLLGESDVIQNRVLSDYYQTISR